MVNIIENLERCFPHNSKGKLMLLRACSVLSNTFGTITWHDKVAFSVKCSVFFSEPYCLACSAPLTTDPQQHYCLLFSKECQTFFSIDFLLEEDHSERVKRLFLSSHFIFPWLYLMAVFFLHSNASWYLTPKTWHLAAEQWPYSAPPKNHIYIILSYNIGGLFWISYN